MSSNLIAAIDVGSSKITTLIANLFEEGKKPSIVGAASTESRGMRKAQIVDIEETVEAITESVEAAERMAGCSLTKVVVSLGGIYVESLNSRGVVAVGDPEGEIVPNDVARVLEAAKAVSLPSTREIIHVIPRSFSVDSQEGIKDPIGMSGVRLEAEAHLITASVTTIRNLTKCLEEIGLGTEMLVFSGLASSESVLTETEKELGVILVDIGGGTTDICMFTESSLAYSSVLPVGAKNITNDIAIGLRVSMESAEKIKIVLGEKKKEIAYPQGKRKPKNRKSEGKDLTAENEDELDFRKLGVEEEIGHLSKKTVLEGIIRPRENEIFQMVGAEIKKSGFGPACPAGVVLTGGGARTVDIVSACKRILALPVRVGCPTGMMGLIDEIEEPQFAAAAGLILFRLKSGFNKEDRLHLTKLGKIVKGIPVGGVINKAAEFIKSLLP